MDKKQTAVEWLLNNLHEIGVNHNLSIKAEKGWLEKRNEIIEQAKAMERQQMFECWETAHQAGRFEGKNIAIENWQTFKEYYNETYTND